MRSMLGKKLKVLAVLENGIIALPSPDGSQNGKWYFLKSVIHKSGRVADNDLFHPFKTTVLYKPYKLLLITHFVS